MIALTILYFYCKSFV